MRIILGVLYVVLLAAAGGCHGTAEDGRTGVHAGARGKQQGRSEMITGTVKHIDLEGGFYGIVTDDGRKLDPVNLPDTLRKDGLRIRARVEELKDRTSAHMWGNLIRIINIERL